MLIWKRALLLFVAIVITAIGIVVWTIERRDVPAETAEVATASAASGAHERVALGDSDSATPSDSHRENASGASSSAPSAADTFAASTTDAVLIVRVVARTTKQPLDSVRIELTSGDLSHPSVASSAGGASTSTSTTDAKGVARIRVAPDVDLDLAADSAREDVGSADVIVPALTSGEQRNLTVELPFGNDLRVCGIVLDGDAKPIANATASVFLADANASLAATSPGATLERSLPDAARGRAVATATTADDGRFVLSVPSWREAYACVTAKGFGPALADLASGHEAEDKALTVRLNRGASIHAHIVDELGASIAGVTAIAHVEAFHLANDEEHVGNALVRAPDATWKATTNAEGACTLEDLVTGMPLTVQLEFQSRIRADVIAIGPLAPGETTAEWSILVGCELSGVFVDEAEAPIPNAPLWLLSADAVRTGGENWHFDDSARGPWRGLSRESLAMWRKTDGAGRFVLHDLDAGSWCVALELQRAYSAAEQNRQYIPEGHLVVISRGARHHEVVLHARHGLFISGKVFEPNGEASIRFAVLTAPSASIEWPIFRSGRELQEGYYALTGPGGIFRVGPVPAGEFELTARGYALPPRGRPLPARVNEKSGEDDVILQLGRRPGVTGRVVDAMTHAGVSAHVIASPNLITVHESSSDGAFSIEGLAPTTYTFIATTEDGRVGLAKAVTIEEPRGIDGLDITVSRGGVLRIRYAGTKSALSCAIEQGDVRFAWPHLKPTETSRVIVPPGETLLRYHLPDSEEASERRVSVRAGDNTEIVIDDG
jgi:hypothetical protein